MEEPGRRDEPGYRSVDQVLRFLAWAVLVAFALGVIAWVVSAGQKETPICGGFSKRMKGLEPSTFCMASRRSSQLSYIREGGNYSGGPARTRERRLPAALAFGGWTDVLVLDGLPGRLDELLEDDAEVHHRLAQVLRPLLG